MLKVGTRWLWLYAHHGITLMSPGNSEFQREEWSPHLRLIPGSGTVHESTWWYKLQTTPAVHRETVGSYLPQGLGEVEHILAPFPQLGLIPTELHTLDWGLGLTAEVARGVERAPGAGGARRHTHAQVSEAVGEGFGLIFYLLPVPCGARGAH